MKTPKDLQSDPILDVIENEQKSHSTLDYTQAQWSARYFSVFYHTWKAISAEHLFTEKHKKAFLDAFDPIQNRDHHVWKVMPLVHDATGRQFLLQFMHDQIHAYADMLMHLSQNQYFAKHQLWLMEGKPDAIKAEIDRRSDPGKAKDEIDTLIKDGLPFQQEHHDYFVSRFSPIYHIGHPLWEQVPHQSPEKNWQEFVLEHLHIRTLAVQLLKAGDDAAFQLRADALLKNLVDYKQAGGQTNADKSRENNQHKL